ncbi:MAG: ATPase, T2SS/T4P/T4SS family [Calditrichia bacterium]|nr:Flp pilus assembly complex ATPase component TadA [Calditrichota bacterium]MCB0266727.1 Flp pilus assembly complex ATPase component TadA [Calditrichota bacterium]MCB0285200.1 Flp pilus assembly complex ATPase component TadA [Calditrichota bacterium]MCB9068388.1 Flp pilus assembly complex ATPase component TadA [Calditrichia bacterium]
MQDSNYKLGVALVKKNILDFETLQRALKIKQDGEPNDRRNLAQILVKEFNVDHNSVYREVAEMYGFQQVHLDKQPLSEKQIEYIRKLLDALPESLRTLMETENIMIFGQEEKPGNKLIIVSVDPTNNNIPTLARAVGAKRYDVCYISPADFKALISEVAPKENEFLKILEDSDIEINEMEDKDANIEEEDLDAEINKSLLVHLVEGMLVESVRTGASDIHVIPKDPKTTEVHFRVDGKLKLWHVQKGVRPEAVAAVIKDRSRNVDRFEREVAQDGFIQRKIDGHHIRFRVSILPIVGREFQYKFESIVIRILDDRNVITDLSKLGLQGSANEFFIKAISKPQGMVIVTGPTGSGKSTTLIAALSYIVTPEVNVLTVEDPVEYIIPGVRQLKISMKNNFEKALRAILRHDPDVVMVGEIRDKETAETGIKLANTGHLTFSTLHTNDAPSAVSRLYKMGIEPFLIAYAINLIIAQRLIRRVCQHCKRPAKDLRPAVPLGLGFTLQEIRDTVFYEAVGCEHCNGGYKGRAAIHEALYFSKGIRDLIFKSGKNIDEEAIRNLAVKEGMLTLRAAARERVKEGSTTLEEIAKATSSD